MPESREDRALGLSVYCVFEARGWRGSKVNYFWTPTVTRFHIIWVHPFIRKVGSSSSNLLIWENEPSPRDLHHLLPFAWEGDGLFFTGTVAAEVDFTVFADEVLGRFLARPFSGAEEGHHRSVRARYTAAADHFAWTSA